MEYRDGEDEQARYRMERCFVADGKWYFSTREGTTIGPYESKKDTLQGVNLYIEHMQKTNGREDVQARRIALEGRWDIVQYR